MYAQLEPQVNQEMPCMNHLPTMQRHDRFGGGAGGGRGTPCHFVHVNIRLSIQLEQLPSEIFNYVRTEIYCHVCPNMTS